LEADVYLPDRVECAPVVMWIHGGALIFGSRREITAMHLEGLLESGYAVVSVDYRLAPETKLPDLFTDIETAYNWIRSVGLNLWGVDTERIGIVGQSAGGYLSLLAGQRLRPRPSAVIALYGYGDVSGSWYSEPDPHYCSEPHVHGGEARRLVGSSTVKDAPGISRIPFYIYCRQRGRWPLEVAGPELASDADALAAWCPVFNVDGRTSPTLLIHGDNDTDVPYGESVRMARALARAGRTQEFITIPRGSHGFDQNPADPASRLAVGKVVAFLGEHVKRQKAENHLASP